MDIDWKKAIEDLAAEREWSIRHLAGDMSLNVQVLYDIQNGKEPSLRTKAKILGRLGYDKSFESVLKLLPDDIAAIVEEWNDGGLDRLAAQASARADKIEEEERRKVALKEEKAKKAKKPNIGKKS